MISEELIDKNVQGSRRCLVWGANPAFVWVAEEACQEASFRAEIWTRENPKIK
jgi:hypothetical protein